MFQNLLNKQVTSFWVALIVVYRDYVIDEWDLIDE